MYQIQYTENFWYEIPAATKYGLPRHAGEI